MSTSLPPPSVTGMGSTAASIHSDSSTTLPLAGPASTRSPPPESSEPATADVKDGEAEAVEETTRASSTKDFYFLPIPKRLRWDPDNPPKFGMGMNLIFAAASSCAVANLYYAQPILIVLSEEFNVEYSEVTNIPTLLQASYAAGLVFLCPLGDLVRRRQLLLTVLFCGAILSLILALVKTIVAFEVISVFLGATSIAGQVLIPLAADLAPPQKRAQAMAIVLSGLLLGILFARLLAGLIAEAGTVKDVYFMSFGLQVLVMGMLWAVVPDYPAKNPDIGYFNILKTMVKFAFTEPLLIQGCIISCFCSAVFTCFWVSQTFLLGDVYGFNSLEIGLFAVIGIFGVFTAPFVGRLVDRMLPWTVTCLGLAVLLGAQAIFTGAAGVSLGAIVVVILALDVGLQLQQVSITARIMSISAEGRARVSAVYIFAIFIGQLIGTSTGSRVYLRWGYRASGGLCMGFIGIGIVAQLLRGPHTKLTTWFGWEGGSSLVKKDQALEEMTVVVEDEEAALGGGEKKRESEDGMPVEALAKVEAGRV